MKKEWNEKWACEGKRKMTYFPKIIGVNDKDD